MKVGRNDPCHCGSGKKYKKCCLPADEAKMPAVVEPPHAKLTAAEPPAPVAPPPPKPVDPRQAAIDLALKQRYEQFKVADLDGKVAIYLSLVEGQGDPPMDAEDAFEMLSTLYQLLARNNQRSRFDELVEALRKKQPDLYEQEKTNCLEWNITNRAAQGRWDELAEPVQEMAARGGKDIDALRRVMDLLDFHGRLKLLLDAARTAWPKVKESREVVSWGIAEFSRRASLYEIYDYLEQHPHAVGADEELLGRLHPYATDEPTWVTKFLKQLTGPVPAAGPLDLAEFDLKRRKPKRRRHDEYDDEDDGESAPEEDGPERALVDLSVTFLGWMRRARNVPLTRGEVGRREMVQFLFNRADGKLDDRRSLMDRMMQPNRKIAKRPIEHPLCPDPIRFDTYLANSFHALGWRSHDAAALMHITPLWLEFLELNGLLTSEQRRKARESLGDLLEPFKGLLSDADDPHLIEALDTWNA